MNKFIVKELKSSNHLCGECLEKADVVMILKVNNDKHKKYLCEQCLANVFANIADSYKTLYSNENLTNILDQVDKILNKE